MALSHAATENSWGFCSYLTSLRGLKFKKGGRSPCNADTLDFLGYPKRKIFSVPLLCPFVGLEEI